VSAKLQNKLVELLTVSILQAIQAFFQVAGCNGSIFLKIGNCSSFGLENKGMLATLLLPLGVLWL